MPVQTNSAIQMNAVTNAGVNVVKSFIDMKATIPQTGTYPRNTRNHWFL